MKNIRHVIQINPSSYHQIALLIGHIAIGWLAWISFHGHFSIFFFAFWGASLFYSLYLASHRKFQIEMNGSEIFWEEKFCLITKQSKVGYGFLWLILESEGKRSHLWIFADSTDEESYRRISRRIAMEHQ